MSECEAARDKPHSDPIVICCPAMTRAVAAAPARERELHLERQLLLARQPDLELDQGHRPSFDRTKVEISPEECRGYP
jgi:hypothetical protein